VNAEVDLVHGLNTGLFLDMREVRSALLQFYPAVKSILNLFSYTGIFQFMRAWEESYPPVISIFQILFSSGRNQIIALTDSMLI